MDESKSKQQTQLVSNKTRTGISIYRNLSRSWNFKSNNHTKNNRIRQRYNYYKYLLPVITLLFATPSYAETVGGVSATAAPVANSSGSVTNQAIQVLQGPYITNTYGGGIQCQGPTLNFTPYVTGAVSAQKPFEDFYDDPVYDLRDLNEDGSLDNPGNILYQVPIRTGQKDNYSLSLGFSATWSKPLDSKLQNQCKEAVATQIEMQQQMIANKRLDFEIARLKNCGELKKQGIYFHPKSPYYSVCADIIVTNPGGVIPQHKHSIPSPVSKKAEDLGGTISTSP
tara:strand:- start:3102 stop:3950 length:849 start_codon:yes stop_codon:yes gene_type:complete